MKLLILLIVLFPVSLNSTANAEYNNNSHGQGSDAPTMIYEAEHAADAAWDAFHKAALGGTLASPEVQTTLEQDLQLSRSLLRKARKAHHEGDLPEVKRLTDQVRDLGKKIVKQSQLEKEK